MGPFADFGDRHLEVRLTPDTVAKVENRTTLKISRKLIFGLLCCCVAFQRHDGGQCVYRKPKLGRSGDEVRQGWCLIDASDSLNLASDRRILIQ
jgi:hypothetical protein